MAIGCQCCGTKGVSVRNMKCANEKCTKTNIQVCLGCQAAAVNMRRPPVCKTCQSTVARYKKKRRGSGISSHPGGFNP